MFISSKISFFSSFPLSHHFSFKTKQFQNHKSNSNGSVLFYTALSYLYVLLFLHGVSLYLSVFISTCASLCVCVFLSMLCCGCFSTSMFPSCWLPGLEDVFSWPSQLHYDYFSLLPTSKNDSTIIGKKKKTNIFSFSFSSSVEGTVIRKGNSSVSVHSTLSSCVRRSMCSPESLLFLLLGMVNTWLK